MGGIYFTFQEQKAHEANLDLKAMGIQIGINLGISILVVTGFCILRPKHNLVYAPKYKYLSENKKPPKIGNEYFGWVKVLFRAKDDFLLERLGYDAILFLKFLRLLRRILLIMSIIGVFALIPMNIVATRNTGQYEVGIDVLTISGINYLNGKLSETSDLRWYWSPFTATWLFTLIIMYFIHSFSNEYIKLRQRYFREEGNEAAKTVLLSNLPHDIRSDEKLKAWVESLGIIKHKITDSLIGVANTKLTSLYEEHELAVEHLEIALASYLNDGKKIAKNRPTMRVGGFLGIGGKKVDVIEYYTKLVSDLDAKIKELRHSTKKAGNYGWISFQQIEHAQEAETIINKYVRINGKKHEPHLNVDARPSPLSRDLIWANLSLDKTKRQVKRWSGRLIYWVFTFLWMIPIGAFAATSNLINLLHFIPNSDVFIEDHAVLMGLIESYFTPIIMSLFFLLLPAFFRFICQQQAYRTHTTLDRKVFLKLYVFFIINNFLVFTLVNIFIGIFGQIHAIVTSGTLTDENVGSYVVQLAKNISDVSTFWVNYVCMKGLGLTMELCQVLPLMILTIRKWISRPSPRQLREYARPPPFDYPQGYSLLVFFFTIALLYSAMAPLVLPFALMYFSIASLVYKYMLMYIFVTKLETGGKMWPVLFQTINIGLILFQVIMIIILNLKSGYIQSYCLIPLPFITLAFQWFYSRRLSDTHCYNVQVNINWMEHQPAKPTSAANQSDKKQNKIHTLKNQFRDPAIYHKLSNPIVHDDVKHLLPTVYKNVTHPKEAFEMLNVHKSPLTNKKNTTITATNENYMDRRNSSMIKMDLDEGLAIKFSTMTENDAIETAMEDYIYENEEEEEQSDDTTSTYSNNNNSNVQQQQHQEQLHLIPAMQLQNITDFNRSDDEFDEKRGLLQDHGEWQQQQQQQDHTSLYSSTSYPFSSTNEKVDYITDQEVFDWRLQRKGVTSEFVEIYETLPAQSTTDLSYLTLQQELEKQKRKDNYMKKRKSAPYIQINNDNKNNNKEDTTHSTLPESLPLHRSQSMVYVKKKKNKEEGVINRNEEEDDADANADEKQRRRLSQPFFVQYGQQHQAAPSELILENKDNQDNRDGNRHTTLRRQSIHITDHVELEHQRRGSWIHQFDQWWPHRYDQHQHQQHQRLGRSHTIMAGPTQQSNNNTSNGGLRRAHTLHDNNNSNSSDNNQQNNNQIFRITYYDDLLDSQ
ncbi:hypothetical protein BJ944DRAFT_236715 [Cunninghamella echinulata]|nr:hypothetical protein BJ944DRAFT_236715 [Cunninghamella echinulata]